MTNEAGFDEVDGAAVIRSVEDDSGAGVVLARLAAGVVEGTTTTLKPLGEDDVGSPAPAVEVGRASLLEDCPGACVDDDGVPSVER